MRTQHWSILGLFLVSGNAFACQSDGGGGTGGAGGSGGAGMGGGTGGTLQGGLMSGGSGAGAGVGGGVGAGNGGVSGLGMAGASAPVVPEQNGALYRFSFDGIVFEVDPRVGARIVTFSLDGKNILTGPSANPDNFGSTYWPSPQSVWNWPPPAEIDKLAYAAHIEGNTLVLDGMVNTALQLSVTKRFRVDHAHGQMVLEFVLNNTGNAAATWAAWAISRVAPGGLTFLGLGAGGSIANNGSTPATFAIQNGVAWYDDAAVPGNTSTKNFFDGQGWLAHVIPADRLLFVQSFPDVAIGAAAEAEIEIYVDGARKYVELEAQGTKTSIAAGGTMSWTERWSLTKLDASVSLSVGSQSLLDATMAVVGKF